ncbi:MAG: hypothetical protein KGS61_21255, partial [Verrucomicrobia bacterium]|nr:hypothetical protein [Verrucomicrobiota bacterium]
MKRPPRLSRKTALVKGTRMRSGWPDGRRDRAARSIGGSARPCSRAVARAALLAALGVQALAGRAADADVRTTPAPPAASLRAEVGFLTDATRRLLAGCRVRADDGTILYTPDGKGNYRALWTRDFAYMVQNAGDLMPPADIEADIRFLLRGQRNDGAVPDRVRPDGVPVYAAGGEDHPLGEPNLDNPQFLVIAVDAYLKLLPPTRRRTLFAEWSAQLDRGMESIPRDAHGLVWNDPARPHSPYGFTDCIGKTGDLLMESLLDWHACQRLAFWHRQARHRDLAREYRRRAWRIEANLDVLWDETAGAFNAATRDCRQLDVWGNAFAIDVGFPLGARRVRVLRFLVHDCDQFVWHGQVRHLLAGQYWQRLLTPVARDRYQNGAYWA